jgi:nitroreductase/NAD-dependent dihydropyrimidine dehydrogenase PreA subunit
MSLIMIDEDLCRRDGICAAACPVGMIELKGGSSWPTSTGNAEDRCISCGHCVAVCPQGALSHRAMAARDCAPLRPEAAPGEDQVEQLLRSRRSIRNYQDRQVERAKLERLTDLARSAPTGTNSQMVRWHVINGREAVRSVASQVVDFLRQLIERNDPMVTKGSLGRAVQVWERGGDPITRGAPALVIAYAPKEYPLAAVDCSIALTFIDLAAPSVGLGTCWAGFLMLTVPQYPPLQAALSLPAGHACYGAMMIGYPKHSYHRIPVRNRALVTWR